MEDDTQSRPQLETPGIPGQLKSVRHVLGPQIKIFVGNTITLNLPSGLSETLNEIMRQTDYWPDEIFARSLILYKAAVEAERAGNRVVILDPDDEIDQEITNL
jgi:hypothetical protein